MTLGEMIKQYRKEHSLSMEAFAKKSGISKAYISLLEKNRHPTTGRPISPSLDTIKQAAAGMQRDVDEVFAQLDPDLNIQLNNQSLEAPGNLIADPFGSHRIPVYSAAGAGKPHLATDDVLYYTDYAGDPDGVLGVVIDGTSMTPTIPDGSVVIADHNATIDSGDIVIVVVNSDQEALCKRIRMYDDGIALLSDNPDFPPRYFSAKEVQDLPVRIIGKCTEVRKKL